MRSRAILGAFAVAVLTAACGAGGNATNTPTSKAAPASSGAAPTPTPSVTGFAVQYLNLIKPVSTASDAFNAAVIALPAAASPDDIALAAKPFLATLTDVNNELLGDDWPVNALKDIKALVTADADLSAAIRNTRRPTDQYVDAFNAAGAKTRTASDVVRADLGLPSPSS